MLRAALLGSIAIASFAAFYAVLAPDGSPFSSPAAIAPPDIAATADIVAGDQARLSVGVLRPSTSEPEERVAVAFQLVRDVTPDDMTAPPPATAPLVRVAPEAVPAPAPKAKTERLYNPVIASAGIIIAQGRKIRLAGIDAPTFAERCGEGAEAWPCGRMARAALRRFVRGRAIECEIPAGEPALPDAALCRVAGDDLSAWLVAQGWAGNTDGYAEAEAAARAETLGLWSQTRPGAQPEELAANSPDSAREINERVSSIP